MGKNKEHREISAATKDGDIGNKTGKQCHVMIGKGYPERCRHTMGVTIGSESFVSLDLVPASLMQG